MSGRALTRMRRNLEGKRRPLYFAEAIALIRVAEAAREVSKASHVAPSDPERMHVAWDALDDALRSLP